MLKLTACSFPFNCPVHLWSCYACPVFHNFLNSVVCACTLLYWYKNIAPVMVLCACSNSVLTLTMEWNKIKNQGQTHAQQAPYSRNTQTSAGPWAAGNRICIITGLVTLLRSCQNLGITIVIFHPFFPKKNRKFPLSIFLLGLHKPWKKCWWN